MKDMLAKKLDLWQSKYLGIYILCFSSPALALSVTTSRTIIGHQPALSIDNGITLINDLNELLYIILPNGTKITPSTTTPIFVPSVPFNQFETLFEMNGTQKPLPATYYYDQNGDIPRTVSPVLGNYTATLKDASGLIITDLTKVVDPCASPYTLTIAATQTTVTSQYGNPKSLSYPARTITYTFVTAPKICYLKPGNMGKGKDWMEYKGESVSGSWNSGTGAIDSVGGGGYKVDFVPNKGFVSNPTQATPTSATFPTTGFANATFQMVMSGGQDKYTYSVTASPASSVKIDASTGMVTLVSKPSGTVTLKATPTNGSAALTYAFNISLWAIPQPTVDKWAVSKAKCTNAGLRVLTRAELTNSPRNNVVQPPNWWPTSNYYTRAIDGSIGGEWGALGNYTGAGWAPNVSSYWTNDPSDADGMYLVRPENGSVSKGATGPLNTYVACRG